METTLMYKRIPDSELRLRKHGVYRIQSYHPGTAVVCKKGTLWVTQAGDLNDHILAQGDEFVSPKRGSVIIEAIGDSAVSIEQLERRN
jgi:hypothetical protein